MNDKPFALDPFDFMARLRAADILHRVGPLRELLRLFQLKGH